MTSESNNIPPAGEEPVRPLLREMLAHLRRHRDTPLQDGIDSAAIVQAALRVLSVGPSPAGPSHLQDSAIVPAMLGRLIRGALEDAESPQPERPEPADGRLARTQSHDGGLAAWLERLHDVLRAAHPMAVEIVGLRVEGCQDREVAQRLGLGLRLVRRIKQDLRPAWEQAMKRWADARVSDLALRHGR